MTRLFYRHAKDTNNEQGKNNFFRIFLIQGVKKDTSGKHVVWQFIDRVAISSRGVPVCDATMAPPSPRYHPRRHGIASRGEWNRADLAIRFEAAAIDATDYWNAISRTMR